MMRDSLGARLRAQRERKRIALSTIAERTKIRASVFESLERDDPSGWPSGIYRRAFVRAYADAIGLDPEPVVREFVARFPDPNDDAQSTHAEGVATEPADDWSEPLRLTLADADSGVLPRSVRLPAGGRGRAYAAVCDGAVVMLIAVAAWVAAGLFWRPLTIATVCYYFGGVVLCGSSPAAWFAARRTRSKPAPATAPAIVQLAAKRSRSSRVGQVQSISIAELEPVRELDEAV
jgi:hypothetical protein